MSRPSDPAPPPPTRTHRRVSRELESGGSQEFTLAAGEAAADVKTDLPELGSIDEVARYAPGPVIGSGGMGAVALRRDEKIGRRVAYKTLHADLDTGELRRRFLREARAQAQLEHPAIVPVYDMGQGADGLFFTMKRVHGHTLARVLQGLADGEPGYVERYTERRLLAAFLQVCQAVHYAHTRGVLHRDLKPSNVMLGEFGEVYVLDWGLARIVDEDPLVPGADTPSSASHAPLRSGSVDLARVTSADVVIGTLAYMSPEQVAGPDVDRRSDVYALGVVLYEILTRRRYRDEASYQSVLAEIADGRIARPSEVRPDVDPELDAICARATAIAAFDRFETAKDLAAAIERVLDGVRDAEARAALSRRHLLRAREHLARRTGAPEDARVGAMHELLRAVTLDPEASDARELLVELVSEAGEEVPGGARQALDRAAESGRLAGLEGTMLGLGAWLLPVPAVLFFFEVRSWPLFWATAVPTLGGLALAAVARARRWTASWVAVLLSLFLGAVIVGASFVLGPFVIVPTMGATCAMFYAMQATRAERTAATIVLTAAVLAPFLLDASGVVPPGFAATDGHIVLLPRMLELPPVATVLSLAWVSGSFTAFASLITGRLRDRLERAERRNIVSAWHLRQLFGASTAAGA